MRHRIHKVDKNLMLLNPVFDIIVKFNKQTFIFNTTQRYIHLEQLSTFQYSWLKQLISSV